MRNATVGAITYEFLFEVYRKMDHDRTTGFIQSRPDENGTQREAFYHEAMGQWEWIGRVLGQVGVLKALQQPPPPPWAGPTSMPRNDFSYPVMTLAECSAADFSNFETFDNYCVAMFSLEYLHYHFKRAGDLVNLAIRSPRFVDSVAAQDDIFRIEDSNRVVFDRSRYEEKVMTRWRDGLDNRNIRPKGGA
ncbi:hypothetical protein [Bradyrhizobium sp. 1]|uniref:hypothetical protein n=1 Tax=Bradyrhizobium sp. 1 TaxID=241591 RepID=UPI001FF9D255|nr:hypothetical protein [Bradyrhizobium sp. 1]MCK1390967.1 hypothetical protein [Bradyrhizobium sp. 1]